MYGQGSERDHGYYNFIADKDLNIIWDTIVKGFMASQELEVEVIGVKDGDIIDGNMCVATPFNMPTTRTRLYEAVARNGFKGKMRIRSTRRQGGRIWLQKVGAEIYPEELESEKVIPKWGAEKKKRGKKK